MILKRKLIDKTSEVSRMTHIQCESDAAEQWFVCKLFWLVFYLDNKTVRNISNLNFAKLYCSGV